MSKEFETAKTILLSNDFKIIDSEYSSESFGSWHITVDTQPKRRVVWDGKDYQLIVREETKAIFNGLNVWKDIWVSEHIEIDKLGSLISEVLQSKFNWPK